MKLHLGCWHRFIPGFVHIDYSDFPHVQFKSSIDSLPFIQDGSVSLIYCSHAFEYFDRDEAVRALCEWRRVLMPRGILRLAVPDFPALVQVYKTSGDISKILGPLYGQMRIDTIQGTHVLYHKTVYDEASLTALLNENGFADIERWDWRATEHARVDDHSQAYYPHMQKDSGVLVSLNLQAYKGG